MDNNVIDMVPVPGSNSSYVPANVGAFGRMATKAKTIMGTVPKASILSRVGSVVGKVASKLLWPLLILDTGVEVYKAYKGSETPPPAPTYGESTYVPDAVTASDESHFLDRKGSTDAVDASNVIDLASKLASLARDLRTSVAVVVKILKAVDDIKQFNEREVWFAQKLDPRSLK